MKTKEQLKALFPKLLPGRVIYCDCGNCTGLYWVANGEPEDEVQDNQLLSLCREVEEMFTDDEADRYGLLIHNLMNKEATSKTTSYCDWHASWEQRIEAAAQVRGLLESKDKVAKLELELQFERNSKVENASLLEKEKMLNWLKHNLTIAEMQRLTKGNLCKSFEEAITIAMKERK